MIVKNIELKNYRVFKDARFSFQEGINIIVGRNGTGKTTILEAIGFAVYGEPIRGSNLVDVLRYGTDLCRVTLSLSNTAEANIVREVKRSNSTASQKITLNDEEVKYSDVNKMRKVFPEKEIFFELAFVDPFRHDLLDVNKRVFRDTFSKYVCDWDIQRVLDNSKSLQITLRSKEDLQDEKLMEIDNLLAERTASIKELEESVAIREKLRKELDSSQKKVSVIEREKSANLVACEKMLNLLGNLDENLKYWEKVERKISDQRELHADMRLEFSKYRSSFVTRFSEHVEKIDLTSRDISGLVESLRYLLNLGSEVTSEFRKIEEKLSGDLDLEKHRIRDLVNRIDNLSRRAVLYEQQKETFAQMLILSDRNRKSLEQESKVRAIHQRMEELIRISWAKQSALFFLRVKDRINQYFGQIGIDMRVVIEEDAVAVLIEDERIGVNALSGGERTLLDLCLRIALIKELDSSNILVLDHPIALLDQRAAIKVISFLDAMKKEFKQIIMTAQEDFPTEVGNRILLDAETGRARLP